VNVVFLGTSDFAAAVLARLARSETHRPALVVTRPDRPRGRGRRLASPPVAEQARALGLELAQPERVNDPSTRALIAAAGGADRARDQDARGARADSPNIIVVCAFGALIKEPLLSELHMLNVHPSLLPRWRGAAPIERAIMAGDAETGVSIMRLEAGLDSGPVCLAASEPIGPHDTYGTLAARLQELGGELLVRVLDRCAQSDPLPFVQQDDSQATYAEKILPIDRLLDPERPALELERRVRALSPHIGAHVTLADGSLLGVAQAAVLEEAALRAQPQDLTDGHASAPGELGLRASHARLLLRCAEGVLELQVVRPPGGRAMDAASYLRGHTVAG
jgi:methionyl-tRNA formyltransferase